LQWDVSFFEVSPNFPSSIFLVRVKFKEEGFFSKSKLLFWTSFQSRLVNLFDCLLFCCFVDRTIKMGH
jgi:hypothetical protein